MGITGVYRELGQGTRTSLASFAVDHFKTHGRPIRIAIDVSIWLFQIQSSRGGTNAPLRTFYYRLIRLLSLSIQPVFVFDGPNRPQWKRNKKVVGAAGSRGNAVTLPDFLAKQLCNLFRFSSHDAPGEAEAECALLQREGIVDAVWTEDVDCLMFGADCTIRNWSAEGKGKVPTHVNVYRASEIKETSGLDRTGMVLVALMSGGDYDTDGLAGCGVKVACEAARAGYGASLCEIRHDDAVRLKAWRDDLTEELRTNSKKTFRRKPRPIEVPELFPDPAVLRFYTHPAVSSASRISSLKAGLVEIDAARTAGRDLDGLRSAWSADSSKKAILTSLLTFFDLPPAVRPLRTMAADMFDWRTVSGARHFIRSLAPSLLVRHLRAAEADGMAKSVSLSRTHPSTDNQAEVRVEFIPIEVVPLDLSVETPDEVVGSNGTISTYDDALDPDGPLGSGGADDDPELTDDARICLFDPEKPARTWIADHLVRVGAAAVVVEWEKKAEAKRVRAAKKAATTTASLQSGASSRRPLGRASSAAAAIGNSATLPTTAGPTRVGISRSMSTTRTTRVNGVDAPIAVLDLSGPASPKKTVGSCEKQQSKGSAGRAGSPSKPVSHPSSPSKPKTVPPPQSTPFPEAELPAPAKTGPTFRLPQIDLDFSTPTRKKRSPLRRTETTPTDWPSSPAASIQATKPTVLTVDASASAVAAPSVRSSQRRTIDHLASPTKPDCADGVRPDVRTGLSPEKKRVCADGEAETRKPRRTLDRTHSAAPFIPPTGRSRSGQVTVLEELPELPEIPDPPDLPDLPALDCPSPKSSTLEPTKVETSKLEAGKTTPTKRPSFKTVSFDLPAFESTSSPETVSISSTPASSSLSRRARSLLTPTQHSIATPLRRTPIYNPSDFTPSGASDFLDGFSLDDAFELESTSSPTSTFSRPNTVDADDSFELNNTFDDFSFGQADGFEFPIGGSQDSLPTPSPDKGSVLPTSSFSLPTDPPAGSETAKEDSEQLIDLTSVYSSPPMSRNSSPMPPSLSSPSPSIKSKPKASVSNVDPVVVSLSSSASGDTLEPDVVKQIAVSSVSLIPTLSSRRSISKDRPPRAQSHVVISADGRSWKWANSQITSAGPRCFAAPLLIDLSDPNPPDRE